LNIAQGDASIESCRDEGVAQRVRPDRLADPGAASGPADGPGGAVLVQPPAIRTREQRPVAALTTARSIARAVRGASGMVTTLPPAFVCAYQTVMYAHSH